MTPSRLPTHGTPRNATQRGALKLAYSPYLDRTALRGEVLIRQMADDFRMFVTGAGGVTADDLEVLGWTPAQIAAHGRAAARAAHADSARARETSRQIARQVRR